MGNYLLKVNNRNTRTRCEICSKLTIKTPERRQWRRSVVFIVNFEHISHLVPLLLLSTEHLIAGWVRSCAYYRWYNNLLFILQIKASLELFVDFL